MHGLRLHRGFDRFANQAACFALFAGKRCLARDAIEHAFPEFAPRTPRRELLGDGVAEVSGKTGQSIETWMQLALEQGAQALGEHWRGAFGADSNCYLAAIDDGRHDEAAQSGLVGNIDGHAKRAGDRGNAGVFGIVAGRGNDQWPATHLIDARLRCDESDTAGALKLGKLRPKPIGGNVDSFGALQQEPRLYGGKLAAARHQRRFAVDADEDRERPHRFSASNRKARRRRVGKALGRKLEFEPVKLRRHDDLAAQARALIDVKGAVQHLEFLMGGSRQFRQPFLVHPHMAGGAGAGAAAFGLDGEAPVADHLHDPPTLECLEAMGRSVRHTHDDEHVRPPSTDAAARTRRLCTGSAKVCQDGRSDGRLAP